MPEIATVTHADPADLGLATGPGSPGDLSGSTAGAGPDLVDQELIVEEISIDGMCGVY